MAKHIHRAAGFVYQGRKDADGGGLAGPVGPQQGKKITFSHVKINALEGLKAIAIGFGQLPDGQSRMHNVHAPKRRESLDKGV